MSDQGRLVAVADKTLGASLAVDHALGVTVLLLDDVYVFNEAGGTLAIIADDGTDIEFDYVSADDVASTIMLAIPTSDALDAGTRVVPWPLTVEKIGTVVLGEAGPLPVLIPPDLGAHPLLAESVIPDPGLAVIVRDDPKGAHPLVLESITGYEPGIASEVLAGPPPDGWGGGPTDPPTTAPVITAAPFAVGTVRVTITPLDPALQSRYEVAASLTSPVAEDGTATIGSTTSTTFDVANLAGVQIPFDAPTFVKVRAVNALGAGSWSAEVSATPRKADNDFISSLFAYIGSIQANQVTAGEFTADLALLAKLLVGTRLDISGDPGNTYLVMYATELDDDGNRVPLIEMRPEGSIWRGKIITDDISVLNGLVLLGLESQIAAGAGMTIMAGVADPSTSPTVVGAYKSTLVAPAAVPTGYRQRGFTSWPGTDALGAPDPSVPAKFARLLVPTTGSFAGTCKIETFTWTLSGSDWVISGPTTITLGNVLGIGESDANSVVWEPTSQTWNVAFADSSGASWCMAQFSSTGSYQDRTSTRSIIGRPTVW